MDKLGGTVVEILEKLPVEVLCETVERFADVGVARPRRFGALPEGRHHMPRFVIVRVFFAVRPIPPQCFLKIAVAVARLRQAPDRIVVIRVEIENLLVTADGDIETPVDQCGLADAVGAFCFDIDNDFARGGAIALRVARFNHLGKRLCSGEMLGLIGKNLSIERRGFFDLAAFGQ